MTKAQPLGYVVAVTGQPGSGKSTLVKNLAARLGDAVALSIDDWWPTAERLANDHRQWIKDGADFNVWSCPAFAEAVRTLRTGGAVVLPTDGTRVEPARFIVIEEARGRCCDETASLIDFLAFIETPNEVALGQKLLQAAENPQNGNRELAGYIHHYLAVIRLIADVFRQRFKPQSDLILDGEEAPEELAIELALAVTRACQ